MCVCVFLRAAAAALLLLCVCVGVGISFVPSLSFRPGLRRFRAPTLDTTRTMLARTALRRVAAAARVRPACANFSGAAAAADDNSAHLKTFKIYRYNPDTQSAPHLQDYVINTKECGCVAGRSEAGCCVLLLLLLLVSPLAGFWCERLCLGAHVVAVFGWETHTPAWSSAGMLHLGFPCFISGPADCLRFVFLPNHAVAVTWNCCPLCNLQTHGSGCFVEDQERARPHPYLPPIVP